MTGDREQKCLNIVRQGIFKNNEIKNKNIFDMSDEEFYSQKNILIKDESFNKYFGLLKDDIESIENILKIV